MNENHKDLIPVGSGSAGEQNLTQTLDLTNQLVEKVLGRQGQSNESEASLADYVNLLLRRKWQFLAVFLATTAVALLFTFTRVPVYRSVALVEVDRVNRVPKKVLRQALVNEPLISTFSLRFVC